MIASVKVIKIKKLADILVILLVAFSCANAQDLFFTVHDIPAANTLLVSDSHRQRGQVRLAGLQTPANAADTGNAIRRLKTLVLGRQVALQPVSGQGALARVAGLPVNQRLLEEGLAALDPAILPLLPAADANRLQAAEQRARQRQLGIWAGKKNSSVVKYHQPYWSEKRLPAPMTRAPTYQPESGR